MTVLKLNYDALWDGICNWSRKVGRVTTRPILLLWYVMRSSETPRKDKLAIFASLAYLVLPVDVLDARRLPVIGWLDEVVSLAVLIRKMAGHITPEMEIKADALLDKWFPEYAGYELVEG